jgi:hypothetical protein
MSSDILHQFILENKDTIICEPSGRTYKKLLYDKNKPVLFQIQKDDEGSYSTMYDQIDEL